MQRTLKDKNANEDSEVEAHLDDSKLVSDGLQGERDAFEILFSRYRPILYGLAQRILRNHEESDDAVQNCSLAAFRKLKSFKYEGAFRSWLARILVNEAITILRKRKRTYSSESSILQERAEAAYPLPDPGPNPEQILSQKQSASALMRELSQLSSGQRAVLLLCEIYEYTAEEAGAKLQVPPSAIRSRLFRARKQLARQFCRQTAPPVQLLTDHSSAVVFSTRQCTQSSPVLAPTHLSGAFQEPKKNNLSSKMGPPRVNPN